MAKRLERHTSTARIHQGNAMFLGYALANARDGDPGAFGDALNPLAGIARGCKKQFIVLAAAECTA